MLPQRFLQQIVAGQVLQRLAQAAGSPLFLIISSIFPAPAGFPAAGVCFFNDTVKTCLQGSCSTRYELQAGSILRITLVSFPLWAEHG